jgi:hypothetical protein
MNYLDRIECKHFNHKNLVHQQRGTQRHVVSSSSPAQPLDEEGAEWRLLGTPDPRGGRGCFLGMSVCV